MRILLFGHQGLGDQILLNGLVHTLRIFYESQGLEELCLVIPNTYVKKTLEHLYEDYPVIRFYLHDESTHDVFQELNNKPTGYKKTIDNKEYTCYMLGMHSVLRSEWQLPGHNWAETFYTFPFGANPSMRYEHFLFPNNMHRAFHKFFQLLDTIGTIGYVVIHDDPSRARIMNQGVLIKYLEKDTMAHLPRIYLGKDRYNSPLIGEQNLPSVKEIVESESLLDLYIILKYASALHLMDSSIACLVDVTNITGKLYIHDYIVPGSGQAFRPEAWTHISKLE